MKTKVRIIKGTFRGVNMQKKKKITCVYFLNGREGRQLLLLLLFFKSKCVMSLFGPGSNEMPIMVPTCS